MRGCVARGPGRTRNPVFQRQNPIMADPTPAVDPDGLLEYSVVYTDRSVNHMSRQFQAVMNDIHASMSRVYDAAACVIVPGGGTYAMEAVARQFATGRKCLVVRNGWFSYRWSQILAAADIPSEEIVLPARRAADEHEAPFAPPPVEEVVERIERERPQLVLAPHVETASGILLPDDYIRQVAAAAHDVDALFVLDGIAAGAVWVDMAESGVDVLISAPQKGWSSSPCAGLVMLRDTAISVLNETTSTSFACDLRKWHEIMQAYVAGGHAYHATMPTDSLVRFRDTVRESEELGLEYLRERQWELGGQVRALLTDRGFRSVAAAGFEAPGVVVSYTSDEGIQNGAKFRDAGMQIAAGVPLMCDEPADFQTFRIGLFGLDKLCNVERTVERLERALDRVT